LIDPTAIIDAGARLASGVSVGPYSVIGADVEIGEGSWIGPHTVINGPTRIGCGNKIYQFSSIGDAPQDKKYDGEPTHLEIGDNNVIREYCTLSRGTIQGGGVTRVGDGNWIMAYVHIAHDCQVGDQTIFANSATLAGHVVVEDCAIIGGFTLVHQFCAIGAHSFTAMGSVISKDVPPYLMVSGHMAKPYGLNSEGLRRREFSAETVAALRRAYKVIYRSQLTLSQAMEQLTLLTDECPQVAMMVAFIRNSERGIVR